MLAEVAVENLGAEVLGAKGLVLVACLGRTDAGGGQTELLRHFSEIHGQAVKVCVVEEESVKPFTNRFQLLGTPTFLLFEDGQVRDSLLGQADYPSLETFVLKRYKPARPTE